MESRRVFNEKLLTPTLGSAVYVWVYMLIEFSCQGVMRKKLIIFLTQMLRSNIFVSAARLLHKLH
jgi:hypothetical protein